MPLNQIVWKQTYNLAPCLTATTDINPLTSFIHTKPKHFNSSYNLSNFTSPPHFSLSLKIKNLFSFWSLDVFIVSLSLNAMKHSTLIQLERTSLCFSFFIIRGWWKNEQQFVVRNNNSMVVVSAFSLKPICEFTPHSGKPVGLGKGKVWLLHVQYLEAWTISQLHDAVGEIRWEHSLYCLFTTWCRRLTKSIKAFLQFCL